MNLRYTTKNKNSWTFNPPEDIKKAGIAQRQTFKDGRTAKAVISKLIKKIDAYRKGELAADSLPMECTFNQLVASYLSTPHYNGLSGSTREAYSTSFRNICSTSYKIKTVGDLTVRDTTPMVASEIYNQWCVKGSAYANKHKRIFGVLLSYAISLGVVPNNPMAKVKTISHEVRSVVWSSEEVEKFLEVAFSKFEYRNVGLIVLLCYEWGQRPVDIQHLRWSSIDFDNDTVTIKQKKRGATVELPLDPDLKKTLLKQKEDYDFQELVAPRFRKMDNSYRPYTGATMSDISRKILEEAGLPDHLQVRDLRKTAITEMVSAGVETTQVMSVSGHKSIKSLNPYIKHTREAASSALTRRKQNK